MESRMSLVEALRALREVRGEEIVVTAMGAAREWMALGSHPLDFIHVPSSMGQAPALGLGLAIARPERRVVVCNGDGSMLMNLGSLVTITAESPPNLTLLLFDNGVYEVTGAQATPGHGPTRRDGQSVDYLAIARGCGFPPESLFEFDDVAVWRSRVAEVIQRKGPTFALLRIAPIPNAVGPSSPGPGKARAAAFMAALRPGNRAAP